MCTKVVFQLYDIDYEGPLLEVEEDGGDLRFQHALQKMNRKTCVFKMIDPIARSHDDGIDICLEVLHYVSQ